MRLLNAFAREIVKTSEKQLLLTRFFVLLQTAARQLQGCLQLLPNSGDEAVGGHNLWRPFLP